MISVFALVLGKNIVDNAYVETFSVLINEKK